jgi:pyridinium-3,5-biscarboxylic acid mononucleotide sulfurtransferase
MIHHPAYRALIDYLKTLGDAAIAFSGGVDSTFLALAAKEALGKKVLALTVVSPYIAQWEIQEAKQLAHEHGIDHVIVEAPIPEEIKNNPVNRCYLCKKQIFSRLLKETESRGFTNLLDGTNKDDSSDFRPGLAALDELHIKSPLALKGITKEMVRLFSKELGLSTWNKPAYACLLTRLPFNHLLDETEIQRIEQAEVFLMNKGFKAVRVRSHGDLARIETQKEHRAALVAEPVASEIHRQFTALGFDYITVDIMGYQMGSFNPKREPAA